MLLQRDRVLFEASDIIWEPWILPENPGPSFVRGAPRRCGAETRIHPFRTASVSPAWRAPPANRLRIFQALTRICWTLSRLERELSGDGVIVGYNHAESALSGLAAKDVIGKHFFRDVAPCASVKEFAGKFAELRAGGKGGSAKLRFVFKYARGAKLIEIAMVHDATRDTTTLLVKAMLSEPNL